MSVYAETIKVSHKGPSPRAVADRFRTKIAVSETGCWEWRGSTYTNGYGYLVVGSKADKTRRNASAHRLAYEIFRGSIPEGLFVCHTCDNQMCVNPEHLFLGTHQDNMQDMLKKGRGRWRPETRPTHCQRGHSFDLFNTNFGSDGRRRCKACARFRLGRK